MNFINVYEPRSNVTADVQRTHVVYTGGARYTNTLLPSDSWGSPGSEFSDASFTLNVPSTQTIVDRFVRIRCFFEVTTDADLQIGLNDALRQYPINSLIEVLTVQINGESLSDNISDKLHALLTYGNNSLTHNGSVSTSPSMNDNYQEYADWATYGSAKNPLASYGENAVEDPRGGFMIVPDLVTPLRKFRVVCTEPIFMSPFFSGLPQHQEEGFVNINQMNFAFRWTRNQKKILSHSALGSAITNVTVTMYKAPEMLVTYISPAETQMLPALQTLAYNKSLDYIKSQPTLNAGVTTTYISDTIKLSQIPESLYFFVRRNRATFDHTDSDSFCRIDNVSILWNNQTSLLSSATPEQLFEMSKRNGCELSYQQFSKYRGSVLKLCFGKDIGLNSGEAMGVQGQYTIQLQIQYTNVSSLPLENPEAALLFMMTGSVQIAEGMCRASLGLLTRDIVLATVAGGSEMDHADYMNLQGGSFFSGLKSFFNKISKFVSPIAHALKNVPGVGAYAGPIGQISDAVGSMTAGAGVAGGRLRGSGVVGGRISGGRRMSRR